MTALEKFYLRGALAVLATYLAFLWTVTDQGLPADLGRNALLAALIGFGLGLAVVLSVLWIWAKKADGAGHGMVDERERLIDMRATRVAFYVLLVGAMASVGMVHLTSRAWVVQQVVLVAIVLAELVRFGGQILLFRRDARP